MSVDLETAPATSTPAPAPESMTRPASPEAAIASKGSGRALPGDVASQLSGAYGADVSGARVHADASANAAADAAGAEAFTYGNDIFVGSGFDAGSAHGQFVLAHEVAHVAQQSGVPQAHLDDAVAQGKAETGSEADPAEAEASAAASAALAGGSHPVSRGPGRIRFFKQGNGSPSQGGHAWMTERALANMGLSAQEGPNGAPSEVRQGRMGNWERDLSQALIPTTAPLMDPIMGILNILAIKEFGRGFQFGEFGGYDPVEHIDNPALLRSDGAFIQGPMLQVGDMNADQRQYESLGPSMMLTHQTGSEGAWADQDDRYQQTLDSQHRADIMNPQDPAAFQVDESGIPIYMQTSKELLKRQLKNAMRLGRRGNDGRGARLFSSAIHIMQDYYAHSNFAEIAINIMLREGGVEINDAQGNVRRYTAADFGGRVLNTGIHALGPDGNTPDAANLTHNGREVMTTGTFNLTDTIASVLEEVSDKWKQFNPFKRDSREPSQLIGAVLDYCEMEGPTEFNGAGRWIADKIRSWAGPIRAVGGTTADIVEGAGDLGARATRGAGRVVSGGLGLLNWANEQLGGSANYFSEEQAAVTGAANSAANTVAGAGHDAAEALRGVLSNLEQLATQLQGESHLLRRAYQWVYENVNPIDALASAAERIPRIGHDVAQLIRRGGDEIKQWLEDKFGALWNRVIDKGVQKINQVISAVRARTNSDQQRTAGAGNTRSDQIARTLGAVGDMYERDETGRLVPRRRTDVPGGPGGEAPRIGIAPTAYNAPSHTEIAKDHGELSQGARDGHGDHAHDPVSTQEEHDHEHPDEAGHGHDHGDDHHGHVHIGSYLAPIAEGMAMAATRSCGDVVSGGWDLVEAAAERDPDPATDRNNPNPAPNYPNTNAAAAQDAMVDQTVDRWFAHPADTRTTWEGFVSATLRNRNGRVGPELLRRLQAATPGSPAPAEGDQELIAAVAPATPVGAQTTPVASHDGPRLDNYDTNRDHYGEASRTRGAMHDPHGVHGHGGHDHGVHGHGGHDHGDHDHGPQHGAAGHMCTDHCTEHQPHGNDAHQCNPMCTAHVSHGADGHMCGPGCDDHVPHGMDEHQCSPVCGDRAA
jgi:hypothetical protein